MKQREHLFYKGKKFTIEWYYDSLGRSKALEYAEGLTDKEKAKLLAIATLLAEVGVLKNKRKFRNEGDGIYALKPKPHRFLCFFVKEHRIIITNGFYKDQQKLPENEKKRALQCRKDYEQRVKQGVYYV